MFTTWRSKEYIRFRIHQKLVFVMLNRDTKNLCCGYKRKQVRSNENVVVNFSVPAQMNVLILRKNVRRDDERNMYYFKRGRRSTRIGVTFGALVMDENLLQNSPLSANEAIVRVDVVVVSKGRNVLLILISSLILNECARMRQGIVRKRERARGRRVSIFILSRPPSSSLLTSCIRFSLRTYRKFVYGQIEGEKKELKKGLFHCSKFNTLSVSCLVKFFILRVWKLDNADSWSPVVKVNLFRCTSAEYLKFRKLTRLFEKMKTYLLHSATILYILATELFPPPTVCAGLITGVGASVVL